MGSSQSQVSHASPRKPAARVDSGNELQSSLPTFLGQLDTDPESAWSGLHCFCWKLLRAHPTPTMRRLAGDDREDLIADLVEDLRSHDFKKLRRYRNIGKPFANWLLVVADRQARSRIRNLVRAAQLATHPEIQPELHRPAEPAVAGAVEAKQAWSCVLEQMDSMDLRERQLLLAASSGMRPRELANALEMDVGDNKKLSDRLRYLRRKLRGLLREHGLWDCVAEILPAKKAH